MSVEGPDLPPVVDLSREDVRLVVLAAVAFNLRHRASANRDPKDVADIWEACERVGRAVGLRIDPLVNSGLEE